MNWETRPSRQPDWEVQLSPLSTHPTTCDPREQFDITGRVVLITGGGRGLGRAMCLGLSRAGAKIAIVERSQADLDETVQQIESGGSEGLGIQADVGDYSSLSGVVSRSIDRFGGLDVLVNNAANLHIGDFIEDLTRELTEQIYRVNVHGPMFLA